MTTETSLNTAEKDFLFQLYRQTNGDQNNQVDSSAIGTAIGMDKSDSRKISEELIGHGFVSVKTLSGGIGITAEGLLEAHRLGAGPEVSPPSIGKAPVISTDGCKAVEETLAKLKKIFDQDRFGFEAIAELVIDIKTIEVQLLSPKPKTAIVKAGLTSIANTLEHAGSDSIQLIHTLIGPTDR